MGVVGFSRGYRSKIQMGEEETFFTPEYRQALSDAGLSVISQTRILDPYLKNHSVVMLITQKG